MRSKAFSLLSAKYVGLCMANGILRSIREFLSDGFNARLVLCLLILGAIAFLLEAPTGVSSQADANATIQFFFHPSCPHCTAQKPFNEELKAEFPGVQWVYHDTSNPDESALLQALASKYGLADWQLGVPATFIGAEAIIGFDNAQGRGVQIREAVRRLALSQSAANSSNSAQATSDALSQISLPIVGNAIDLSSLSLPVLAAVLGLVDGFNPCAMWVLVYMIAVILGMEDKRRVWVLVAAFLAASGILYFLFMTAWLNAFLFLGYVRPVQLAIGLIALGGGVLSLKEYSESKGELTCKATNDGDKARTMGKIDALLSSSQLTLAGLAGVVALAFAVNSVEFVCSFGIPAVFTQVLSLQHLSSLEYYGYIALYDIFFMLDDLVVFGLAAFAASYGAGQKYARWCKLIGGGLLAVLGLLLLFAPRALV